MNSCEHSQKQEIVVARFDSDRLVLRPFESKDAAGLFEIFSHPRARCFADDRLDTMEEAVADVERRGANTLEFAVCLKDHDAIIGVMFAAKEEPDNVAHIGQLLVNTPLLRKPVHFGQALLPRNKRAIACGVWRVGMVGKN